MYSVPAPPTIGAEKLAARDMYALCYEKQLELISWVQNCAERFHKDNGVFMNLDLEYLEQSD